MTDYGHDLQFGTFITPDAAQADRVVELALLTEAAGLELATFQDHPYQARFLDAWTVIATVLARLDDEHGDGGQGGAAAWLRANGLEDDVLERLRQRLAGR